MTKEYTRFGQTIQQREADSTDDWQDVPLDDLVEASIAVGVADEMRKRNRKNPPILSIRVVRSDRNKAIAAELGLDADELADRLARPDHNEGTTKRVSEERLDEIASELKMSGTEIRDRFAGRFQG